MEAHQERVTATPGRPQPGFVAKVVEALRILMEVFKAAKPCRLNLVVVLVVAAIFIKVEQASEVLRCLGEGPAHTGGSRIGRFICCISALVTLSLSAWYFCRVLMHFQFPDSPRDTAIVKKVTLWLPRFIGVIPPLGLGIAFFYSASPYASPDSPAKTRLWIYAAVCFSIALLLGTFFWTRHALLDDELPLDSRPDAL